MKLDRPRRSPPGSTDEPYPTHQQTPVHTTIIIIVVIILLFSFRVLLQNYHLCVDVVAAAAAPALFKTALMHI